MRRWMLRVVRHNSIDRWAGHSCPAAERGKSAPPTGQQSFGGTLVLLALGLIVTVPCPALSCSLCGGSFQKRPTFREEAGQNSARMILYGTFTKSEPGATPGAGKTTLQIDTVLRSDSWLNGKKVVDLPRYQPVDEKNPPKFLVFCDIFKDKIDPYRGILLAATRPQQEGVHTEPLLRGLRVFQPAA